MNADLRAAFAPPVQQPAPDAPLTLIQRLMKLWRAKFFSPKDFVRRALIICVLFGVAHLLGLKEFTSVLNGTTGSLALGWTISAMLGLAYVILYVAFVLLVPILLLAAAMLAVWARIYRQSTHDC